MGEGIERVTWEKHSVAGDSSVEMGDWRVGLLIIVCYMYVHNCNVACTLPIPQYLLAKP